MIVSCSFSGMNLILRLVRFGGMRWRELDVGVHAHAARFARAGKTARASGRFLVVAVAARTAVPEPFPADVLSWISSHRIPPCRGARLYQREAVSHGTCFAISVIAKGGFLMV